MDWEEPWRSEPFGPAGSDGSVSPQSSQVVSFTPAPSGEDGRSDLLSIAKRFGEPLYTLFLPSKVSSGPLGPGSEEPFCPDR